MMKGAVMALFTVIFLIIALAPSAHSISIRDLISRYVFSAPATQVNVISYTDYMADKDNNGINDTLVLELATSNAAGNFIFVANLFDKSGVLTNETSKTLDAGTNKINVTFSSIFLTQHQFNYSIKIYNSSYILKHRKDGILTQNYSTYEEGFEILDIKNSKADNSLTINITINLDNETIKRTHYSGNFNISSIKIGKKTIKTNYTTDFYDFRDFATTSYISGFTDNGIDTNSDNKHNFLQINIKSQIVKDDDYAISFALYDLFDNLIEIRNESFFLNSGQNTLSFKINGSGIYDKKLNGPFIVKR